MFFLFVFKNQCDVNTFQELYKQTFCFNKRFFPDTLYDNVFIIFIVGKEHVIIFSQKCY